MHDSERLPWHKSCPTLAVSSTTFIARNETELEESRQVTLQRGKPQVLGRVKTTYLVYLSAHCITRLTQYLDVYGWMPCTVSPGLRTAAMGWPAARANNKREKSERDGIIIKDACPSRLLPSVPGSYPSPSLIDYGSRYFWQRIVSGRRGTISL